MNSKKERKAKTLFEINKELAMIKAKAAYFRGLTPPEIEQLYGVPRHVSHYQICGNKAGNRRSGGVWGKERKAWREKVLTRALQKNSQAFKEVAGLSLDVLKKQILLYLRETEEGKRLGVKETKLLSDVLANVDRIFRLEEGKPTSHNLQEYVDATPKEIRDELSRVLKELDDNDPMVDYSDGGQGGPEEPPVH